MNETEPRPPLDFWQRIAIGLLLLVMALSGGCVIYSRASWRDPGDNLSVALMTAVGGGFFLFCAVALLIIWLARNADSR